VHAAWLGQVIGVLLGFPFEHKVASTVRISSYPKPYDKAPVDDDWYYEMVALRGFETYGIDMTVAELGAQWKLNNAGSWGSSRAARLALAAGVSPPETGHPRRNPLWWSIGSQFSADVYGLVAPGMPNLAGRLARDLGHINGYAEGADGGVFMAGMVSLAFVETDTRVIVRKAARLIHPSSPYRQALDLVIALAEAGKSAAEVAAAVEDRWHIEYPGTNNAVPNGGIVALAVWFGRGDFLDTVNVALQAGDFTDADCNAANAGAVVGALRGRAALPADLASALGDRIAGAEMGGIPVTPPVDETISGLAARTARIGEAFVRASGGKVSGETLELPRQEPETQPAERFALGDLMEDFAPGWTLARAGFGGGHGGLGGLRGMTHLQDDVLATWPRDEVRGLVIHRKARLEAGAELSVDVGVEPGRAWHFDLYADNDRLLTRLIEAPRPEAGKGGPAPPRPADARGAPAIVWQSIRHDLGRFAGREVTLRLYQRVLVGGRTAGNAYWRGLKLAASRRDGP
jgi:hypothetical protein